MPFQKPVGADEKLNRAGDGKDRTGKDDRHNAGQAQP